MLINLTPDFLNEQSYLIIQMVFYVGLRHNTKATIMVRKISGIGAIMFLKYDVKTHF